MNRTRILGVALFGVLFLPLLFVQAQQRDPRKEAQDVFKGYQNKLGYQKPVNEIVDSLKALEEIANEMHHGVPFHVKRMLLHRAPAVRRQAAKTLGAIGVNPETASELVHSLAEALNDRDPEVVASVLLALARMGPYAKLQAPKFLEELKNPDPRVRRAATGVFFHLEESDVKLIPAAISALEDTDLGPDGSTGLSCVSTMAMIYLSNRKTAAHAAAPGLIKIANSIKGSDDYRLRALSTLASVAPMERLPIDTARKWLREAESVEHLTKATGLLSVLGVYAKDSLPELIATARLKPAKDPLAEQRIKLGVVYALRSIGPDAKDALPTLEAMAATNDLTVRRSVAETIKIVRGVE